MLRRILVCGHRSTQALEGTPTPPLPLVCGSQKNHSIVETAGQPTAPRPPKPAHLPKRALEPSSSVTPVANAAPARKKAPPHKRPREASADEDEEAFAESSRTNSSFRPATEVRVRVPAQKRQAPPKVPPKTAKQAPRAPLALVTPSVPPPPLPSRQALSSRSVLTCDDQDFQEAVGQEEAVGRRGETQAEAAEVAESRGSGKKLTGALFVGQKRGFWMTKMCI